MQEVFWDRVEIIGRCVGDVLQWKCEKVVVFVDTLNWDGVWMWHQAQG